MNSKTYINLPGLHNGTRLAVKKIDMKQHFPMNMLFDFKHPQ